MKKITFMLVSTFVALSLLLSACAVATPAPTATTEPTTVPPTATVAPDISGTITVSGAFALYPLMQVWGDAFHKLHPNVVFDISGGGAGKGMTDALSGAVDIGMVSRQVKKEEEAQGAYTIPVVKDAVFGVVSDKNPVIAQIQAQGITQDILRKIFITGEIKTWGEVVGKPEVTDAIHVYTRSDSAGSADIWAQFLGGKVQADILKTAVGVNADPGLLDAVVKDPLGIGYNNLGFAFDLTSGKVAAGAVVIPIDADKNGKADPVEVIDSLTKATDAVANNTYPSPPGRVENLVTKGKPAGLTQAFILWILTDGQQLVGQAGYVQLPADALAASVAKVK
ncbi:MAG: substrate-binding domain-containing protein [Anaerolineales bacterium]